MMILIVEDNPKTRNMIKEIVRNNVLHLSGIIESDDGREAVQLYQQHSPELVLMDLNVRSVDGLQASKDILNTNPQAKIIIVTMYNDEVYRKTAKEIGALDFVLKEEVRRLPEVINKLF